jgi:hypothetical protein
MESSSDKDCEVMEYVVFCSAKGMIVDTYPFLSDWAG